MVGWCSSAPELAIQCHIPRLVFQSSIRRLWTKMPIAGKSLTHLHSSSMEGGGRPPTLHRARQHTKPETRIHMWVKSTSSGVILYALLAFLFSICLLFGETRISCENCGWSELHRPDWPCLFAAIRLPQPPVPRDYWSAPSLWALSHWFYTAFMAWQPVFQPTTLSRKSVIPRLASPAHYCLVYSQAIPQLHTLNQEIPGER